MGKKIIVNERVLKHMLMEMTKERVMLNEAISVADAYGKFYSTKISKEDYDLAVRGTVNMTPFHKALLDCMIYSKESGEWDWTVLAQGCGEVWEKADANVRQLLLKAVKTKELNPRNPNDFYENTIKIGQTKAATKAQVASNGLVKLYEDDKVLITCTTTYSASHKFYADSHWCTASDIYGQYNGFCMFLNYTTYEEACLVQVVPKESRADAYQIQLYADREGQICTFEDDGVDYDHMIDDLSTKVPNLNEIFRNTFKPEVTMDLIRRTEAENKEDSKYWTPKTEERLKEIEKEINERIDFSSFDNAIKSMLANCFRWGEHCQSDWGSDVAVRVYTAGNRNFPYFFLQYEVDVEGAISDDASSWLWSCRRFFNANKINNKVFLCKVGELDTDGGQTFEVVKQIDDYYSGIIAIGNVIGYIYKYDNDGNIYNVYSCETGEIILSNQYIDYFTSDYILLGTNKGPYALYSPTKNQIVLDNILAYYTSWGDLYVKTNETVKHRDANSRGFMLLDRLIKNK